MKVRRSFEKLAGGTLRCYLEVIDEGDFPKREIFFGDDGDVYVAREGHFLCSSITKEGSIEDLLVWSDEVVAKIRRQLEEWREVDLPPVTEFVL